MAVGVNATGNPIIVRTFDNGNTWDTSFVSMDTITFQKIVFTDSNTAIAVGWNPDCTTGLIARTSDFGNTWIIIVAPVGLYDVDCPSTAVGYATGYAGAILKSIDGGISWSPLTLGFQVNSITNHSSVEFLDDLNGFIAFGHDTVFKTIDGGSTWTVSFSGQNVGIGNTSFTSPASGYLLVGTIGVYEIFKTTDLGASWTLQGFISSSGILTSMFFTNDSTGYVSG
jgi:photosystem II stability/assembly factor-like uncharacterized protein